MLIALLPAFIHPSAKAQDNYEIQVYGADTVAPKTLMVELHSNFTIDGFPPFTGFDISSRRNLAYQSRRARDA